jgi:hypothetical protein
MSCNTNSNAVVSNEDLFNRAVAAKCMHKLGYSIRFFHVDGGAVISAKRVQIRSRYQLYHYHFDC